MSFVFKYTATTEIYTYGHTLSLHDASSDLGVNFAGHMEALRVDIEQSKEPRMSARRDGGAVVRVERRRHWSDEEKLAILTETTQPGAIMAVVARRYGIGAGQPIGSEQVRARECQSGSH